MRKGLTFLTENCFDQTLTRPMVRAIYTLNGNKQNRTMRRLRLRDFSGVNRDSVADNTRILYDILRDTTGKPQLALYGIFYKQDIENIRSLPPR